MTDYAELLVALPILTRQLEAALREGKWTESYDTADTIEGIAYRLKMIAFDSRPRTSV